MSEAKRMADEMIADLLKVLSEDAEEHKRYFPSDRAYWNMHTDSIQVITQLTADLASEKAGHAAAEQMIEDCGVHLGRLGQQLAAANAIVEKLFNAVCDSVVMLEGSHLHRRTMQAINEAQPLYNAIQAAQALTKEHADD